MCNIQLDAHLHVIIQDGSELKPTVVHLCFNTLEFAFKKIISSNISETLQEMYCAAKKDAVF